MVNLKFWEWFNLPSEDPSNYFAPDLEETVEWIEVDDLVRLHIPGLLLPLYGTIERVREEIQFALVNCFDGADRWVSVDEIELKLKATAVEITAAITTT